MQAMSSLAHRPRESADAELWVARLGTVEYEEALGLQHRVRDARKTGAIADTLLLLEHPPVYTRGRRSEPGELPMAPQWYADQGIAIHDVDRGGKVTYHGPGQLVGYPILDTQIVEGDVPRLVGAIEQALIAALAGEGIAARPDSAGRGVWAGSGETEGKIASVGLRITSGITTHGFAVNVNNNLQPFTWIKPCGLDDAATSIDQQTSSGDRMKCFSKAVAFELAQQLGLRQRLITPQALERAISSDLVLSA